MRRVYQKFLSDRMSLAIARHLSWLTATALAVICVLVVVDALLSRINLALITAGFVAYVLWQWSERHKERWRVLSRQCEQLGIRRVNKVGDVASRLVCDAEARVGLTRSDLEATLPLSQSRQFLSFAEDEAWTNALVARNHWLEVRQTLHYFGVKPEELAEG